MSLITCRSFFRLILFGSLAFCSIGDAYCQSRSYIDSLTRATALSKTDTEKVEILLKLSSVHKTGSLQQYAAEFDPTAFIRIHRGYIVNKHKIDKIGLSQLHIGEKALPISKKYREVVLAQL